MLKEVHDKFAPVKPTKNIQNDEKSNSRNHNDDFNSWFIFIQI